MLRDSSGFYSYAIFEHLKEWPAFNIPQIRTVYKLRKDKYEVRLYCLVVDVIADDCVLILSSMKEVNNARDCEP